MSVVPAKSQKLPRLRSELALLKGAPAVTGEPTWLVHDPLQNRYIQIDAATHEVLSLWEDCDTVEELVARVDRQGRIAIDRDGIARLVEFVLHNKLTDLPKSGGWKSLSKERRDVAHSSFAWLAHNYLFFRIPLCQPQEQLERTLPIARLFATRQAFGLLIVLAILGSYLVSRQWDAFATTFQHVFTWEGAFAVGLTIAIVKIAHELGHAYTAVHYGCRVPTMGIAFMMMAPMLYTDVTDAWRLKDHRQRLVIASAGIMVELGLAAIALFAWAFLPEGPLRSIAFIIGAVSLVTSLLINLNPLMRFDGYYLLADWLRIENLQSRSFELACWKLREWLFGFGLPCPEQLSRRHRTIMIVYAWSVWIYRLFLFIGIALIVYHYFFKLLGVALFVFEIGYFVINPLWSELKVWYSLRHSMRPGYRTCGTALGFVAIVLACMIPWSTRIEVPAVLEPRSHTKVYPTKPARVVAIHFSQGQTVAAGDPLVTFSAPDLEKDIDLAEIKLRLARMQHARRGADAVDREATLELESTIASLSTRIEGLKTEMQELVARAPISGRVVEINTDLHAGRWVGAKEMIAFIAAPQELVVRGYVSESDLWRIDRGYTGAFIPEAAQRPRVEVVVDEVGLGGAGQIEIVDLASTYGGRIAVNLDDKRRLVPVSAHYTVRMTASSDTSPQELIGRGVAVISGRPESLLSHLWRQTITVLLRESGF